MIHYTYTATGQKIAQQLMDEDGRVSTCRDYAGLFVYVNDDLAWVSTPHGRFFKVNHGAPGAEEFEVELHIRDHLGNTRGTVVRRNLQYILTSQTNYYPFGYPFYEGVKTGDGSLTQNRYLYNGKELQDDFGLNWYDYGARFYDAQLARWHVIDALSESYYPISPYAYVANNPIAFIDPDGNYIFGIIGSTREQRQAARQFASESGGDVKNIHRKNVSVDYSYGGAGADGVFTLVGSSQSFNRDGSKQSPHGEIRQVEGLKAAEMYMNSPGENIGESIMKASLNILYGVANEPVKLATGRTIAGTPILPSEKTDAFVNTVPGAVLSVVRATSVVNTTASNLPKNQYNAFLKQEGRVSNAASSRMHQVNRANDVSSEQASRFQTLVQQITGIVRRVRDDNE